MSTFAKEGGGGTPPVPLEPSKKPQTCGFLLFIKAQRQVHWLPRALIRMLKSLYHPLNLAKILSLERK